MARRRESCQAKMQSTMRGLFAATRKPSQLPLDNLEDTCAQPIKVIDGAAGLVQVHHPFPADNVLAWSLQGCPALVTPTDEGYVVDSDLLLADQQMLACRTIVHDHSEILRRLEMLWSLRWNKHASVPEHTWDQICDFARTHLPRGQLQLPPLTVEDWNRALQAFKPNAAAGPCGFTRTDLLHFTNSQVSEMLKFFAAIESGAPWPQQWCVGLVYMLQKRLAATRSKAFDPSPCFPCCTGCMLASGQVNFLLSLVTTRLIYSVASCNNIKLQMCGTLWGSAWKSPSKHLVLSLDWWRTL